MQEIPGKYIKYQKYTYHISDSRYLNLLENTMSITENVESNPNDINMDIIFQQDGAPQHSPDKLRTI